jgi:hypothetical protein
VPKDRGTFLVSATVQKVDQRGREIGGEKAIECAVHYVTTGDGVRYRAVPAGPKANGLRVPSDKTLGEVAAGQWWPVADREALPAGSEAEGPKLQFPVHVGPWPAVCYQEEHREAVETQLQMYRTTRLQKEGPAWVNKESLTRARRIERDVDPHSVIEAPEGVGSILESGRFQVTGTVYFRPLQPFDPNPSIPTEGQEPKFVSEQQLEYQYPNAA